MTAETARAADSGERLVELQRQLSEARDFEAGTAEVYALLGCSPVDLQRVLDTIVATATRLCRAEFAFIHLVRADRLELAASSGASDDFVRFTRANPLSPDRGSVAGRTALEGRTIHLADCAADPEFSAQDYQRLGGQRTTLGVPLFGDGSVIGVLALMRAEVQPFSDGEIELVETFAGQAAIAIVNSRLVDELQTRTDDLNDALGTLEATAEIQRLTSTSIADARPVFDAIVRNALTLCDGLFANVFRFDGELLLFEASENSDKGYDQILREKYPMRPDRSQVSGRVILTHSTVCLEDALADPDYDRRFPTRLRWRRIIGVPMIRDGEAIGVITVGWRDPGPVPKRQREVLEAFADQAVIAINNVELFEKVEARTRDLQQALEHQTATGEVLGVISRSTSELQPVLDAIVETAARLCHADWAVIFRLFPDGRLHIGAASAGREEFMAFVAARPSEVHRGTITGRTVIEAAPVHVPDVLDDPEYTWHEVQRVGGYRTALGIPLMRGDTVLGVISLQRNRVEPFSESEVDLVTTFADQAVIAMDNVRLFEAVEARTQELQQTLDYQTATSEVLSVISRSPASAQEVLETIVSTFGRLCNADFAFVFMRKDDGLFHIEAVHPANTEYLDFLHSNPVHPDRGSTTGRAVVERCTIHIPDATRDPDYSWTAWTDISGSRTVLGVPLLREGEAIGVIAASRARVEPFSGNEIDLIETFADQAIIAIENARLFEVLGARTRDLQEALDYQMATSSVLETISRSPGAIEPVLDAIVERAAGLCDAADCAVFLREGDALRLAAWMGSIPRSFHRLTLSRDTVVGRAVIDAKAVEVDDLGEAEEFVTGRAISREAGVRTVLAVPLIRDGTAQGAISLRRTEVRPFSRDQVTRLATFAEQAIIAIENARLFSELEMRTRELGASLEELRSAQDRLVHTEKLASLGQLTAGIAHEIKNPLNFVNNFAKLSHELLEELAGLLEAPLAALDPKDQAEATELFGIVRDNLAKIAHHGGRADSIVKNMLQHARQGAAEWRTADVNTIVDEAVNLAYHGARAEHPNLTLKVDRSLAANLPKIECCPQDLMRVVLNLVTNGIHAANEKRASGLAGFTPAISVATQEDDDKIVIEVRDNGTGIPSEIRDQIFLPFFTTKPAGEGTGLGLSLSHDIVVKQHCGNFEVESEPGRFTLFRVRLPLTALGRVAKS